jgi:hypothetical protein
MYKSSTLVLKTYFFKRSRFVAYSIALRVAKSANAFSIRKFKKTKVLLNSSTTLQSPLLLTTNVHPYMNL